jgi:predicted phosphohydrolase
MSVYAISDLHLSFGTNKPMDIFNGWRDYTERLKKNWTVKDEDTVIIVGDISWAMRLDETFNDFCFLESLPGKKILIKGNHDYWWATKKKTDKYILENNFSTISLLYNSAVKVEKFCICGTRGWMVRPNTESDRKILNREVGRLQNSVDIACKTDLEPVAFLHYPPVYDGWVCWPIFNVLKKSGIKRCYYGHIHNPKEQKRLIQDYDGIELHLVACDYTNFSPVFVG